MAYKNSADNYGTIAKTLHWLTALLFLASYVSVYYRQWFTAKETDANWTALQLHLSLGVSIAVVVVLRIFWRLYNRPPEEEPGSRLEHLAAKIGHYALYGVMIIMPITGYIGTGVATEFFFLFDIPKFADTWLFTNVFSQNFGVTFQEFEKPIDFLHKEVLGAWLVWMLIAGHVLAALFHHYGKGDRTLKKMTTGRA